MYIRECTYTMCSKHYTCIFSCRIKSTDITVTYNMAVDGLPSKTYVHSLSPQVRLS